MSNTPTNETAALRAALTTAIPLLSYAAGREAAENPQLSEQMLSAADTMTHVLARTEPA